MFAPETQAGQRFMWTAWDLMKCYGTPQPFMPASLLASQFEALEEPGPDEHPVTVSIEPSPREIVARIVAALGLPTNNTLMR